MTTPHPVAYTAAQLQSLADDYAAQFYALPKLSIDCVGWHLFESDERGWEIEKEDDAGVFEYDNDAIAHVVLGAVAGVRHMVLALAAHMMHEQANAASVWEEKRAKEESDG